MRGRLGALGAAALAAMTLLSGCGSTGGTAKTEPAPAKPVIDGSYAVKGNLDASLKLDNGIFSYQSDYNTGKGTYAVSDKPVQRGLFAITFNLSDEDSQDKCMVSEKPSQSPFCDRGSSGTFDPYILNELLVRISSDKSSVELLPYAPAYLPDRIKGAEAWANLPWMDPNSTEPKNTKTADWKSFQDPDRMTLIRQ